MIQLAALVFGLVFVLIGLLGFVPSITPGGMLLGVFHVNASHNIIHILSGMVALAAYYYGALASQTYFRVFGIIYGLVAILGFFVGHGFLLGFMANNPADNWLHLAIAVVSLYLGYVYDVEEERSVPLHESPRATY